MDYFTKDMLLVGAVWSGIVGLADVNSFEQNNQLYSGVVNEKFTQDTQPQTIPLYAILPRKEKFVLDVRSEKPRRTLD